MLVKIKSKETEAVTYVTMRQITIYPMDGGRYKVRFYDMCNSTIVLKNLPEEEVKKIEEAIHQDFIIDLTENYDSYMKTKAEKENYETELTGPIQPGLFPIDTNNQSHTL